jgi:lipoyl(octanoyl) transferase
MEYEAAWRLQDRLAAEIAAGERPPTLLLLEHPHTYTFGRSGHAEHLLWDEHELARRGIRVHWVDRGGDVTYHGPGQLVGYPLLPLGTEGLRVDSKNDSARVPKADYVGYVRKLERALIVALEQLGVDGQQLEGLTGVWVAGVWRLASAELHNGLAKIAAIGVKVDARGITRHGFALNVSLDMSYWEGIIGCGLKDHQVAAIADLMDPPPAMEQVMTAVIAGFQQVFGFDIAERIDL